MDLVPDTRRQNHFGSKNQTLLTLVLVSKDEAKHRFHEEHASKIVSLMSEYCLCQRVKPPSDPKSPFTSDADYIAALQARAKNI